MRRLSRESGHELHPYAVAITVGQRDAQSLVFTEQEEMADKNSSPAGPQGSMRTGIASVHCEKEKKNSCLKRLAILTGVDTANLRRSQLVNSNARSAF